LFIPCIYRHDTRAVVPYEGLRATTFDAAMDHARLIARALGALAVAGVEHVVRTPQGRAVTIVTFER
jgi:hypothetical protein